MFLKRETGSEAIEAQGAVTSISAKSNRKCRPRLSKTLYRERYRVEHFSRMLKHFRHFGNRYDKPAANLHTMVKLASMGRWVRPYKSRVK